MTWISLELQIARLRPQFAMNGMEIYYKTKSHIGREVVEKNIE